MLIVKIIDTCDTDRCRNPNKVDITYLNGGLGNTSGIDRDDSSEETLTEKRRHDNGTESGGSGHQDRKSHVTTSNVGTQVGSLSTVNASNEDHTSHEGWVQLESRAQAEG